MYPKHADVTVTDTHPNLMYGAGGALGGAGIGALIQYLRDKDILPGLLAGGLIGGGLGAGGKALHSHLTDTPPAAPGPEVDNEYTAQIAAEKARLDPNQMLPKTGI